MVRQVRQLYNHRIFTTKHVFLWSTLSPTVQNTAVCSRPYRQYIYCAETWCLTLHLLKFVVWLCKVSKGSCLTANSHRFSALSSTGRLSVLPSTHRHSTLIHSQYPHRLSVLSSTLSTPIDSQYSHRLSVLSSTLSTLIELSALFSTLNTVLSLTLSTFIES